MKLTKEPGILIELKNGSVIKGEILGIDMAMNTHMRNVILTVKGKNPVKLEQLTIRGNNVRYFILPVSPLSLSLILSLSLTHSPSFPFSISLFLSLSGKYPIRHISY